MWRHNNQICWPNRCTYCKFCLFKMDAMEVFCLTFYVLFSYWIYRTNILSSEQKHLIPRAVLQHRVPRSRSSGSSSRLQPSGVKIPEDHRVLYLENAHLLNILITVTPGKFWKVSLRFFECKLLRRSMFSIMFNKFFHQNVGTFTFNKRHLS